MMPSSGLIRQILDKRVDGNAFEIKDTRSSYRIEADKIAELLRVPTLDALQSGLTEILGPLQPRVLERKTAVQVSTHPSEVVTCELADGSSHKLLMKYSGFERDSFGHKGGVRYEAIVYRDVVSRVGLSSPRWYGNYHEADAGRTWVILQFIENAQRIQKSQTPLASAANGIGRFQRATSALVPAPPLNSYDGEYYSGWAVRTRDLARQADVKRPWLLPLCDTFEDLSAELAAWQPTIIHGEYYPKNILVSGGIVCPVDWESAAFAAGEIDVASLTEFWPAKTVKACENAYVEGRWPDGPPPQFERMLGLARLYIHFRWLGVAAEWTRSGAAARLNRLENDADQLGLL
jgi:hypothetical protein